MDVERKEESRRPRDTRRNRDEEVGRKRKIKRKEERQGQRRRWPIRACVFAKKERETEGERLRRMGQD